MPSPLFTQDNKKPRTNQRMGKYDPETAQAWALIMKRIRELRAEGNTLEAIGKLMHVGRAAVSRWISEDVGGEKTTYGDMLRYAKALGIPRDELIGKPCETPSTNSFDKMVGKILEEFSQDNSLTANDVAQKANIPATTVSAIFSGELTATPSLLYKMCSVLEVGASTVLNRAARQVEEEQ